MSIYDYTVEEFEREWDYVDSFFDFEDKSDETDFDNKSDSSVNNCDKF